MSIYLAKKELIDILDKSNLEYSINLETQRAIAVNKKGTYLILDEYSEEKLREVAKKKNTYIDIEFWNYNYCTEKNLDPNVVDELVEKLTVDVPNLGDFSVGTLVSIIVVHEILLNTYKIKNIDLYLEYISNIKISQKIIRNFMINMEYHLPLTQNYLSLIIEVFNDETIYDFIFRDCCNFTLEEFVTIMSSFKLNDINMASYYICNKFKDTVTLLKYIGECIDMFEGKIDFNERIVYTKKNDEYYLGFCLLTMELTPEIEPLYYSVVKKYMDKSGSINIIVDDSKKDSILVEKRKKEILNYFEKF